MDFNIEKLFIVLLVFCFALLSLRFIRKKAQAPSDTAPVFALLSDFGYDFAVATMEAIIIKALPNARVIHIDHTINKFNVVSGAFVLQQAYAHCPKGTIFIGVVDPGVGSERQAICIEHEGYTFIGPNNGLFHHILKQGNCRVYAVDEQIIKPASYTFHGRDVFTPAAINVARKDYGFLKSMNADKIVLLENVEHSSIVTYIDSFGNVKTNIPIDNRFSNAEYITVRIDGIPYVIKFVKTFAEVQKGELLAYEGSNKTLELAVNLGSAQQDLKIFVGQEIFVIHAQ